jgi:hypothetical protein
MPRWRAGTPATSDGYLELYDDAIKLYGYSPEPLGKADVPALA